MHFKSLVILACISLTLALPASEKREDVNLDKRQNAKDDDLNKRFLPFWMMNRREDSEVNVDKRSPYYYKREDGKDDEMNKRFFGTWMIPRREDSEVNVDKRSPHNW